MNPTIEGVLIKAGGIAEVVEFPADEFLPRCQVLIGATTVDCFSISRDIDVWVDDDGMYADREVNTSLMMLVIAISKKSLKQPLYGDALMVGFNKEGDSISLSQDQIELILTLHKMAQTL